ncbi:YodC family protein [Bradyrhizobium cenepequi]
MELKPGDVVMLKSGGHPITVAEVNEDSVECVWMGIDGDLFRETLPAAVLEAANPEDEEDDEEDEEEDDEEGEDEDDDDRRKGKVA